VYGLAVAGTATARALLDRGVEVVLVDDTSSEEGITVASSLASSLGSPLYTAPDDEVLAQLVARCPTVIPSPGVPETHRVVALAQRQRCELMSEIELAYRWESARDGGPRPMLAVTGTDGKTTTTLLAVAMLASSGVRSVAAGNTETPLVQALDLDVDAFVVECTSFRLAWTSTFRADAAAWLNLAPDHLNWHRSMATYEAAKNQIFAHQRADDVAIGFVDDPAVMRRLGDAPGRPVTFGTNDADYAVRAGALSGPQGPIAPLDVMARALPHDVTNALAASALVIETGLATPNAIADALGSFRGAPHRLELVAERNGVRWFDDSKATTPHAASTAIRGFERIVLIAGGYDKGVDLSPMAAEQDRLRAVVAIGDTGPKLAALFDAVGDAIVVDGLEHAVAVAAGLSRPGDVVLFSPGCASFDQYDGFEERGRHFVALVAALDAETTDTTPRPQHRTGKALP